MWRLVRELGHVSTPTGARRFARRIHRITGGNPFYIFELIKTMFAQGLLAADEQSGNGRPRRRRSKAARSFRSPARCTTSSPSGWTGSPRSWARSSSPSRWPAARAAGRKCSRTCTGSPGSTPPAVCDALAERRLLVEGAGVVSLPASGDRARGARSGSRPPGGGRCTARWPRRWSWSRPPADARSVAGEVARHAEQGGDRAAGLSLGAARERGRAGTLRLRRGALLARPRLGGRGGPRRRHEEVDRRTAALLETAGWSEPPVKRKGRPPVTREIVGEDLDLPVRS